MHQQQNGNQASDVQTFGGRIEADITCGWFLHQLFFRPRGQVCQHPSPPQLLYQVHGLIFAAKNSF
jgi:hypothetical protein